MYVQSVLGRKIKLSYLEIYLLPQRLKSTFFEIISSLLLGPLRLKKYLKTLILANIATLQICTFWRILSHCASWIVIDWVSEIGILRSEIYERNGLIKGFLHFLLNFCHFLFIFESSTAPSASSTLKSHQKFGKKNEKNALFNLRSNLYTFLKATSETRLLKTDSVHH